MNLLLKNIAQELNQTQISLDKMDGIEKQQAFDRLPKSMQRMLDGLWGQLYSDRGRKNIPIKDGHWSGEEGDSFWIPDGNCIPADKGYSNMLNKSWNQILTENGIRGIEFKEGRVDFSLIADITITKDWEDLIGIEGLQNLYKTGNRQYLHEAAFEEMKKMKGFDSKEEAYKYKEVRNLVWHEEPDCYTLRLVPREVHDNIKHFGGIAMLQIIEEELNK